MAHSQLRAKASPSTRVGALILLLLPFGVVTEVDIDLEGNGDAALSWIHEIAPTFRKTLRLEYSGPQVVRRLLHFSTLRPRIRFQGAEAKSEHGCSLFSPRANHFVSVAGLMPAIRSDGEGKLPAEVAATMVRPSQVSLSERRPLRLSQLPRALSLVDCCCCKIACHMHGVAAVALHYATLRDQIIHERRPHYEYELMITSSRSRVRKSRIPAAKRYRHEMPISIWSGLGENLRNATALALVG